MKMLKKLSRQPWFAVLSLGVIAGCLAQWLVLPAPWFLGPLVTTLFLAIRGFTPKNMPQLMIQSSQAIIGMMLGSAFQVNLLGFLLQWWFPILVSFLLILSFCVLSAFMLSKWCHLPLATTLLGTLPGAAVGLLNFADELGADVRLVAFMQYLRVIIVVLLTSALTHLFSESSTSSNVPIDSFDWLIFAIVAGTAVCGALIGILIRLPAGAMIGPMLLGILLNICGVPIGHWPTGFLQAAYLILSISIGLRFTWTSFLAAAKLLPRFLIQLVALIIWSALCGLLLTFVTGVDLLTGYLATNPGSMDVISILALGTGANFSFVLAVQMFRMFSLTILGAPLVRVVLYLTNRKSKVAIKLSK